MLKSLLMNKKAAFLLVIGIPFFLSSCFLFKKTQGPRLPEAPKKVTEKPEFPEKKEPEKVKAPFDVKAFGEKVKKPVYEVALFLPLNIDEVMSDSGFAIGNRQPLPAATLSGLEFYEGALMALDSLRKKNIQIRLHVYDSKSEREPLTSLLDSKKLDSTDLIIGDVKGDAFREIGAYAKKQQINFVSATYPNDGGISNNPFLIIVNSTLRVHCFAIQSFAQQKFSNKKITVIYYNNPQGKQNLQYLQEAYKESKNSQKTPLHSFEWNNNTSADDLVSKLSPDKTNVIILTTLYPDVSLNIISQLAPLADQYKINVVGMPTLEGLSELRENKYKGITLYYGSVFQYINMDRYPAMKRMMWRYFDQYHARPGNYALNAFETVFYFGNLLNKEGRYFNEDLNDPVGRIMTSFNFQPVYHSDPSNPPDYFENNRIYFIRERDGKVTPAN